MRNCYQVLSDYTKNGIQPIISPIPSETKPQLFSVIDANQLNQNEYHSTQKMFGINPNAGNEDSFCIPYAKIGKICGSSDGEKVGQFVSHYNFGPGFNEVGVSKYY